MKKILLFLFGLFFTFCGALANAPTGNSLITGNMTTALNSTGGILTESFYEQITLPFAPTDDLDMSSSTLAPTMYLPCLGLSYPSKGYKVTLLTSGTISLSASSNEIATNQFAFLVSTSYDASLISKKYQVVGNGTTATLTPGTYYIILLTDNKYGKFKVNITFTGFPNITSISPTSGTTAGGTAVTITGTDFTNATAVKFGSTAATNFTVNSDTQITATSPAGSAGTVDVTVTAAGGTSATSTADYFTYAQTRWGLAGADDEAPTSWVSSGTLANALSYANGLSSGKAYIQLLSDVSTTAPLDFATGKTTILDLNGNDIDRGLAVATANGNVITVNGTLTLKDGSTTSVASQGKITGGYTSSSGGGGIYNIGNLTMQGGKITGNKTTFDGQGGGGVYTNGNFTMTGGSIANNEAKNWGGGVGLYGGNFTMLGGSITGNKSKFGGVYFGSNALTVGGTAVIDNNQTTDATPVEYNVDIRNTYSITVSASTPLTTGASIGVTTASAPTSGLPISITGNNSADYSSYFTSDNSSYQVRHSGTGTAQVVKLSVDPAPAVSSISPASGTAIGGTSVIITGDNFTGVTAVKFGTTAATSYAVDSPTQITAVSPAGSAGTVHVTVTTAGITSIDDPANQFTYVVPTVTSVSIPSNGTYKTGDILNFTVNYSEVVTIDGGTPYIPITLNTGGPAIAYYVSGGGSTALVFRYTVSAGNLDADGITLSNSITPNGAIIRNNKGANAVLTLNGVPATTGIKVDAVRPTASIVVADNDLKVGETSLVTFTFSEAVTGFDNADLIIEGGTLTAVSSADGGITWTATFTPTALLEDATNAITLDNTGVTDAAGNAGTGTTTSNNYAINTKTLVVTTNADSGAGSLRQAITDSNPGGEIRFAGNYTITLGSMLFITKNLTITGEGHTITISGNNLYRVFYINSGKTLTLNQLTIANGKSDYGGAIYNLGTATMTDCTFSGNSANTYGGAILNNGTANVTNSTFSGNSAQDGGAICNVPGSTANVTNSTFSGNSASNGGGISNNGTAKVTNCTFAGNTANSQGGGISNWNGSLTIRNSILTNNSGGNYYERSTTSGTNNLTDDGTGGAAFTNSSTIRLGVLGYYGGYTQTFPLLPGSSAINAGDAATGAAAPVNSLDQRGVTRSQCDIGAFESQGFTLTKTGGDNQSTTAGTAFASPLTMSVTSAFSEPVNGGVVTFTGPASGAGTNPGTSTATIASGAVSLSVTANGTVGGPYNVAASAAGAASINFSLTNVSPFVTSVSVPASKTYKIGDLLEFTVNYSANVTVAGGTPSFPITLNTGGPVQASYVSGSSTSALVFRYTVASGLLDADGITVGSAISLNGATLKDGSGNDAVLTLNGVPATTGIKVDAVRPTASIVVADNDLKVGETSLVTFTFSEAVTNFTNADLIIEGGTLTAVSSTDGGITWTATFTPTALLEDATNAITLDNTGVTDAAGNAGTGSTTSNNYAINTKTLVVTTNADSGAGSLRQAITDSNPGGEIRFAGDYTITLGSMLFITKNLTITGEGHTITISGNNLYRVFYINSGKTLTLNQLTIANGKSDYGGAIYNLGTATMTNCTFSGNSATIYGGAIWNFGTANVTNCTFSGNSASNGGAICNDPNGTANVTNSTFSGNSCAGSGGAIWNFGTATVRNSIFTNNTGGNYSGSGAINGTNNLSDAPSAGVLTNSTSIRLGVLGYYGGNTQTFPLLPGSSAIDAGDAANGTALDQRGVTRSQCDIGAFESQGFTLTKTGGDNQSTTAGTAFASPLTMSVTSAFSEPVNGGVVTFTGPASGAGTNPATSTATIASGAVSRNVTANGTVGGPYNVTASATGAASVNFSLTNVSPFVTSVSVPSNGTSKIGDLLEFTVNYSANVTVAGGTPSFPITLNTGGTVQASYTSGSGTSALVFRYTVASGLLDADGITVGSAIILNGATLKDGSGNDAVLTLNGVPATTGIKVDAVRPTASIVIADNALKAGETSLVSITFSETVSGFDNADLTVEGGTLTAVSPTGDASSFTATFTPTASLEDATNAITLDYTGITDLAGNAGTGSVSSGNYAIDTKRPTATIGMADNALKAGETSLVSFTFSETVSGFDNADLTVEGGTLTAVSPTGDASSFTATFTPTASLEDASNAITLDYTGVNDLAGNAGTGTTTSNNYTIDTLLPVVSSVSSTTTDATYKLGDVILIQLSLSEAVTVTGTPTLALNSGGTASYTSGTGTATLTFSYTVGSGQSNADLDYSATSSLALAGGTIQDAAGNNATLTLPTVGGANSLGGQKDILIGIVPTVTTQAISVVGSITATANGNISSLGFPNPTQYGVVWSTSANPTVALTSKTTLGTAGATGSFSSTITGLTPDTRYYLKAYATNSAGTVYGDEVTFTTLQPAITSATYDAQTGVLTLTCQNINNGDIINPAKLTITGEAGSTYTLTTGSVTASSTTSVTITLNASDKDACKAIFTNNGNSPANGAAYNIAAADDWDADIIAGDISDLTGNGITASNACSNPTAGGTIAAPQAGCNPFDPTELTSTALPSGYTGTLEYKWQSSTTSSTGGFTDIAGSNASTYNPGPLTQTTWFKRLARVDCKSDWTDAVESNTVTITVYAIPSAPTSGSNTYTYDGTAKTATVIVGTNQKVDWFTNITGINSISSLTATNAGIYLGYAEIINTTTGCSSSRREITLTINKKPLTITADGVAKTYGTALSAGASTKFKAEETGVGSEKVTSVTLTPDAAGSSAKTAAGTTYQITPSLATGTGGFLESNYEINYKPISLTVEKAILNITADNKAKCYDGKIFNDGYRVTLQGLASGENQSVLDGTLSFEGTATNAINPGSYSIIPKGLSSANYAITFHAGTLTINALPESPIIGSSDVALGSISGYTTDTAMSAYKWSISDGGTISSGADTQNVKILWNALGSHTITVNCTNALGCSGASSKIVTVYPQSVASISGDTIICAGSESLIKIKLTGKAPWNISYTDGTTTQTVNNIKETTYIFRVSPSAGTTKTYTLVNVTDATGNAALVSGKASITVKAITVPGSIAADQKIAPGSKPAPITSVTAGSGDGIISYSWESSADKGLNWTAIANQNGAGYSPGVQTSETWFRRIAISTDQSVVCSATSTPVKITTWGTGIDEKTQNALTAYAVGNTEIRIKGQVSAEAVAFLYDIQGKLIVTRNLEEGSLNTISTPNCKPGVYLLLVKDTDKAQSFKLMMK